MPVSAHPTPDRSVAPTPSEAASVGPGTRKDVAALIGFSSQTGEHAATHGRGSGRSVYTERGGTRGDRANGPRLERSA